MPARGVKRATVGLAAALLAAGSTLPTPAGAEGEAAFLQATAAASGVRMGLAAPNYAAVEQFVDAGGPVVQAHIDHLGTSVAFASNPYPGDLVIVGPGLFSALTGLPNPGSYPLYVASSFPTTPESKLSQPGYELAAGSQEQSSRASSTSGARSDAFSLASVTATSVARRQPDSGIVEAEAATVAETISVGGVLRIASGRAWAKVTRLPGGEAQREASLEIGAMSIGDQSVGFRDGALVLAGTTTPLPADGPLMTLLAQHKIKIEYLKATEDADGVVSPGLAIRQELAIPGGPTMVMSLVFGRAVAYANAGGTTTRETVASDGDGAGGTVVVGDGGPGDTEVGSADPVGSGAGGISVPAGRDPAPLPATVLDTGPQLRSAAPQPASPTVAAAPGVSGGTQEAVTRPVGVAGAALGASTSSFYLILVVGAVVVLAAAQFLRLFGVRLTWRS